MNILLKILIVVVSILYLAFVLYRIRKSKIQIIDSVFWILFSFLIIIIALFPGIVEWGAVLTNIQPASLTFLVIIFLLIVKLFLLSMKVSHMELKIKVLSQKIALDDYRNKEASETKDTPEETKKANL